MMESILFTWLQGADFYRDLHRCAVQSLPPGNGKTWLDVGCGPGLVTRLAAEQAYCAHGVDTNPRMIKAAQALARKHHSSAIFSVADITAGPLSADVVSAASLLAVLDDKRAGLNALWQCVLPGGHLLIIEPTARMNPLNAKALIESGGVSRKRIIGLRLWAAVRQNRTIDPALLASSRVSREISNYYTVWWVLGFLKKCERYVVAARANITQHEGTKKSAGNPALFSGTASTYFVTGTATGLAATGAATTSFGLKLAPAAFAI